MKDNNALIYGIVAIVVVLVFVGAWIAVSTLAPAPYDVSLTLSANNSGTLYPYQTTAFNITVTNNGGKEVVGLPVAFYLNGIQRNYSTYAILAHQSIRTTINYTYTSPGGYLFTAAVDPGNVLNIANRTLTRAGRSFVIAQPQQADVYESVPNSNITYTDSFTTYSGTGLLTGSLMANLYQVSALLGINAADNGILSKTYQDLYPYIAVSNGAFSVYSNGSRSYASWLQGTVTPAEIAYIVSSFNKKVVQVRDGSEIVEYSALGNLTSLCSYYQGGWTKIVEFYNNSASGSCLGIAENNYTPSEGNIIVSDLKSNRLGQVVTSNQLNATKQISWSSFYYNNATVLGQFVQYQSNAIGASTLFQLDTPPGIFLSGITRVNTNISRVNSTCLGLGALINGTSVCSIALPTTGTIGNQTYGAVYTKFISPNYTVGVYSLIGETYLTLAHANAGELISRLGINSTQVEWQSPFKSSCAFEGGFGCRFNGIDSNGSTNITITDLNYTSVELDNITCGMGGGFPSAPLSGTLVEGQNITLQTQCHTIPVPVFAAESDFNLWLGFTYRNAPMMANGTMNVSNGYS